MPGGIVYLPVTQTSTEEYPGPYWRPGQPLEVAPIIEFTSITHFDGRFATPLPEVLPHYHEYFSSPAVIDSVLYCWGVRRGADGILTISTRRFDFVSRTSREVVLDFRTEFETDNPGYLEPPMHVDRGILYRTTRYEWIVQPDWSGFAR